MDVQLDVYDKALVWLGRIGDPLELDCTLRDNASGAFTLTVRSDDPNYGFLTTPGCRVALTYRGRAEYSGLVKTSAGRITPGGNLTVEVRDDWRLLGNTLAWPRPAAPIAPTSVGNATKEELGQAWVPDPSSGPYESGTVLGQTGTYLWPNGAAANWPGVIITSAEQAIKHLIEVNLKTRLNRPITIAPNLSRGGDPVAAGRLPDVRFQPVDEAIADLLSWSGLSLRVVQEAAGTIGVDVYEPDEWQQKLTVASGIIRDGTWSRTSPAATRFVLGGPGEDAARAFATVADPVREAEWGDIVEVFRDASSDAKTVWPDSLEEKYRVDKYFTLRAEPLAADKAAFLAAMTKVGSAALTEGRATSGVNTSLSESETFYFGGAEGFHLGDLLTIRAADEAEYTDRITAAQIHLDRGGLSVTPTVGNKSDDSARSTAATVAKLAAAQRKLSTGK